MFYLGHILTKYYTRQSMYSFCCHYKSQYIYSKRCAAMVKLCSCNKFCSTCNCPGVKYNFVYWHRNFQSCNSKCYVTIKQFYAYNIFWYTSSCPRVPFNYVYCHCKYQRDHSKHYVFTFVVNTYLCFFKPLNSMFDNCHFFIPIRRAIIQFIFIFNFEGNHFYFFKSTLLVDSCVI